MRLGIGAVFLPALCACPAFGQTAVTTYHNDNSRSGLYPSEQLLSPASLQGGQFGKRFTYPVDGSIYAQPLYLPRVAIQGQLHDVVFVATAHDSVYAFDADDPAANPSPLWQTSFLNAATNVTSVPEADVDCPVISPELGVVGTPVIDSVSGTLYAIAETKEPGPAYVYRLHALDITTGAERTNSPVVIAAPGFDALLYKQRGALLLANGLVYSEWSSHCDHGLYHGYIMSNDAATLNPVAVYNATPNGESASFWNAGAGPAGDANGNVFVVSANGDFDAGASNYGDSVIELQPQELTVSDFFTPYDQSILADNDLDLGSSGSLLLPDEAGSAAHPHVLVTAGKEGRIYLLDRDRLGGAQVSADIAALASDNVLGHAAFGMASWFNGQLYIASELSPVRSFALSNAALSATPTAQSSDVLPTLGATPSISSNGTNNGVLWIDIFAGGSVLKAFDTGTLNKLYDSSVIAGDAAGTFSEFMVPTVANSRVYLASAGSLDVYGELNSTPPAILGIVNAASFAGPAVAPGSLVSIFGTGLSLATGGVSALPLPISFEDVEVTINGAPAPLLYVSPSQINAQVPVASSIGEAQIVVQVAGSESASFALTIQPSAPGIFVAQATAAALNQDGSVNGPQNPAPAGSIVSVFLTGAESLEASGVDGEPAPANGPFPGSANISATLGGTTAAVQYAGPAPGFVGLIQMNLVMPALAPGQYPLSIGIDGAAANSANLYVQ